MQRPDPGDRLTAAALDRLTQARDVTTLPFPELVRHFYAEPGLTDFLPDGSYRIDPRSDDRIVYNAARARRPHDNRPAPGADEGCIVCRGRTTGVVDVTPLSAGYTFINKNLYPILFPEVERPAAGMHFLQWTSTLHDEDWHTLSPEDGAVVVERLAALEGYLLEKGGAHLPTSPDNPTSAPVFVSIIKNYGRLVGGSLAHGHQQIALTNVAPRRILDDWRFTQLRGEPFSAFMLRENAPSLRIRDYGPALLAVPHFMRRPYDMILLLKESDKAHLHQLTPDERLAVATGWHDALGALHELMAELGRELAYNVVTHNGPGNGLYFEFLPYTQEMGGFEHLGLYICQGDPEQAAAQIRAHLASR